jgi:hypothetical protein
MTAGETLKDFVPYLIGLAVWAFVLYAIIRSAVNANEVKKNLEAQTKLLMKIAEQNGVAVEDIKDCVK